MSTFGSDPIFSVRTGTPNGPGDAIARAQAAERAGFDQIWFGNDIFGPSGAMAVAAAAMHTSTIRLGVGVFEPVSLHPVQIAMIASDLQDLSGGRLLLGMGAGSDVFFGFAGLQRPAPVRVTREAIVAVRALLAGQAPVDVTGSGTGWTPQAKLSKPPSVVPPIYVGAMGPQMLAMSGAVADGALPLCLPPSGYGRVRAQIEAGAERAGRSLDAFDLPACIWCSIDDDTAVARRRFAAHVAPYSGSLSKDALREEGFDIAEFERVQTTLLAEGADAAASAVTDDMMRLGIVGGPVEVVEQCRAMLTAGVRHISFGPPLGEDPLAAIEVLGTDVLSALHSSQRHAVAETVMIGDVATAVDQAFRPNGVRLGVIVPADVPVGVHDAVDAIVAAHSLDPRRRVARLRPPAGALAVESADLVDFLDRYGHEYSLAVLPERSATDDVRSAAGRNGCSLVVIAEPGA